MKQKGLIIVAGGVGERAGKNIPKQFVEIDNKPVFIHSLEKFFEYDKHIMCVVVCHSDYIHQCKNLIQYFLSDKNITVITGGETRFHSVKNGLEFLKKINFDGIIAVHDAARPCINIDLIKRCFEKAIQFGNAIPVIPVSESIRELCEASFGKDETTVMADRNKFVIVQTPQCAEFSVLYKAFQQDYQSIFTDEANVLEFYGEKINIVEGDKNNIKITYPIDFEIAQLILQKEKYE